MSERKLIPTSTPGIFQRGGSFCVVVRVNGKPKKHAPTMKAAKLLKAKLTADIDRGEYVADSRVTFEAFARQWIASYDGRTAQRVRASTLRDYRRALGLTESGELTGNGACAYFGRMRLSAIRPLDVKAYAKTIADKGKAQNTVRLYLAPLRALLADAFEHGVIRSNPAAGLRVSVGAPAKEKPALTEAQALAVLAQVPEKHRLLVEFIAQTGVRISEALALTKADVDFGSRTVSITKRLYDGKIDTPKTRNSVRRFRLGDELARKLWSAVATKPDEARLFPNAGNRHTAYWMIRAAGERAGIPFPVGNHSWRHTAASIMARAGMDRDDIRDALGHATWDFTRTNYVHRYEDDVPDPSAALGHFTIRAETPGLRAVAGDYR